MGDAARIVHASAVALNGKGVLIRGASGSGKSALALQLMAMGARLVADDRVALCREGDTVLMRAPEAIAGLIEARGVGILRSDPVPEAPLVLVVDRDTPETDRLPPRRSVELLGVAVDVVHNSDAASFPAAIRQYLLGARAE